MIKRSFFEKDEQLVHLDDDIHDVFTLARGDATAIDADGIEVARLSHGDCFGCEAILNANSYIGNKTRNNGALSRWNVAVCVPNGTCEAMQLHIPELWDALDPHVFDTMKLNVKRAGSKLLLTRLVEPYTTARKASIKRADPTSVRRAAVCYKFQTLIKKGNTELSSGRQTREGGQIMNNVNQLHEQQDGISHRMTKLEGVLADMVVEQSEIRAMLLELGAQQATSQQRQTEVLVQAVHEALAARTPSAVADHGNGSSRSPSAVADHRNGSKKSVQIVKDANMKSPSLHDARTPVCRVETQQVGVDDEDDFTWRK